MTEPTLNANTPLLECLSYIANLETRDILSLEDAKIVLANIKIILVNQNFAQEGALISGCKTRLEELLMACSSNIEASPELEKLIAEINNVLQR